MSGQISNKDLLADMRAVYVRQAGRRFTHQVYQEYGRYSWFLVRNRFGSWNKALERARLPIACGRSGRHGIGPSQTARPGRVACLKCDRGFASWDVRKNRICPVCTAHQESEEPIYAVALAL